MEGFWNYAKQNYYAIKFDVHLCTYILYISNTIFTDPSPQIKTEDNLSLATL